MFTTTKIPANSNQFASLVDDVISARAALAARPDDQCPQIDEPDLLCDRLVTAEETLALHPSTNLSELVQKIELLSIQADVADALTQPVSSGIFGDLYRLAGIAR